MNDHADTLREVVARYVGKTSRITDWIVRDLLAALEAGRSGEAEPVAWTVFDAKGIRFTLYNRELAEAIAERGLLVLPMFGSYEWLDAKIDTWKPINRLPYTWEREIGIQWRAANAAAPQQPPPVGVTDEADELLRAMGLDPGRFRTEAGFLNPNKIMAAIRHPEDYAGLYIAAAPQQPTGRSGEAIAFDFCWLVELFWPHENSRGLYHATEGRTADPHEARRFASRKDAEYAASKLATGDSEEWRAVEHGFERAAPQQSPPVTDAMAEALDHYLAVEHDIAIGRQAARDALTVAIHHHPAPTIDSPEIGSKSIGEAGDDALSLSDVAGTLGEIAEGFDGGEYHVTAETRRVLIDFAHGLTDHPLFAVVGHYFAQNPAPGTTPKPSVSEAEKCPTCLGFCGDAGPTCAERFASRDWAAWLDQQAAHVEHIAGLVHVRLTITEAKFIAEALRGANDHA